MNKDSTASMQHIAKRLAFLDLAVVWRLDPPSDPVVLCPLQLHQLVAQAVVSTNLSQLAGRRTKNDQRHEAVVHLVSRLWGQYTQSTHRFERLCSREQRVAQKEAKIEVVQKELVQAAEDVRKNNKYSDRGRVVTR